MLQYLPLAASAIGALGSLFGGDDEEPANAPTTSNTNYVTRSYMPGLGQTVASRAEELLRTTPMAPYTGQLPGMTDLQEQAVGAAPGAVGSWQPYMTAAGQSVEDRTRSLMNPYTDLVLNRIAELGQRNLTESLLPQINTTFTGAGQFGSTRNADFTNRALRDVNESILGQQSGALERGFGQAQSTALADLERQRALATTMPQLQWGDIGHLWDVGAGERGVGVEQERYNRENVMQGQQLPWQQLQTAGNIAAGLPMDVKTEGFGTQAPPTTQTMNPWQSGLQGALGGLSMYNAFNKAFPS